MRFDWRRVLAAPVLAEPEPNALVNDRPRLAIVGPVEGATQYVFCISPAGCAQALVGASSNGEKWITTPRTTVAGLDWTWTGAWRDFSSVLYPGWEAYDAMPRRWAVAACRDGNLQCTWSASRPLRSLLSPSLEDVNRVYIKRYEGTTAQRLEWLAPPTLPQEFTHYKLCIVSGGSYLQGTERPMRYLGSLPMIVRDLCSGDWPQGTQPAFQQQLPFEISSRCSSQAQCEMPRLVATFNVANQEHWFLDLREHPELLSQAGKVVVWAVATCTQSMCTWSSLETGMIELPVAYRPPVPIMQTVGGSPIRMDWAHWKGNDSYVVCLRTTSGNCDRDNLLVNPASTTSPPRAECVLEGPYPGTRGSGSLLFQVQACSAEWGGCIWSGPVPVQFSDLHPYRGSATQWQCRL